MATGMTTYTMIDITHVPGNKVQAENYRVVLSRGGVNGSTDRGVVTMEVGDFEAFVGRANEMLHRNTKA